MLQVYDRKFGLVGKHELVSLGSVQQFAHVFSILWHFNGMYEDMLIYGK